MSGGVQQSRTAEAKVPCRCETRSGQGGQFQFVLVAEPRCVVPVVGQIVPGQRMQEDIQIAPVENEKGQKLAQ